MAAVTGPAGGSAGGVTATGPTAVAGLVSGGGTEGDTAAGPAAVTGPAGNPLMPNKTAAICPVRCLMGEPPAETGPDLFHPDLGLDPDRDPGEDFAPDLVLDPERDLCGDPSPTDDKERLPSLSTEPQLPEDFLPLGRECDCRDLAGEGGCDVGRAASAAAGCVASP